MPEISAKFQRIDDDDDDDDDGVTPDGGAK